MTTPSLPRLLQDLPWVLPHNVTTGFTCLDTSFYSPVKNSREDAIKKAKGGGASAGAAEGEHAVYAFNRRIMSLAGCALQESTSTIGGVPNLPDGPRVVLGARFRPTIGVGVSRLIGKSAIKLSPASSLHIDGDVKVESLDLDGALYVYAPPGVEMVIRNLSVKNKGCVRRELTLEELAVEGGADEVSRLRGYVYEEVEAQELRAVAPYGQVVVDGNATGTPSDEERFEWKMRGGVEAMSIS